VSAANDADGNNIVLNGSDTLFEVTQAVLTACPTAVTDGISYAGGGSGVGSGAMVANTQQVSPMSRALKTGEYCGVSIDYDNDTTTGTNGKELAVQASTEDLMVGLDGIVIEANSINACTNQLANGGTFQVTDTSGNPVTSCPGCDGTGHYTLASSIDLLRLIYGGMHNDGTTFDCNSNVRRTVVKDWNKLFSATCGTNNCPNGLTHAWRRSDLSGTTDAFVSLIGFGARGIGTLSTAPFNAARKVNPFCNGTDANTAPTVACAGITPSPCTSTQACDTNGFCMPASFGGSMDFTDADPIRTPCATGDQVCNSGLNANGTALTAINGTLGLVLPILFPDNKVNIPTVADDYPLTNCSAGKFELVSSGNNHEKCPGGPNFLGSCFQPFFQANTADTHHFACIAKSNAHATGTPSGLDGRAWNLPLKLNNAGGLYNVDANNREMIFSAFRIHTTTSVSGATSPTCQLGDDTAQIGCLVNADPCSIGYAGRQADIPNANQAEAVNGIFPTDTNIINLVSGGTPVYPIARRLFFASLVGFSSGKLRGGEAALATCYEDNNIVKTAIAGANFVQLPSPGIKCFSANQSPLPGCGGTVQTNCGATATNGVPDFVANQY
jgi:ABC-type phosphate transport system substrate-binding protein